MNIYTRKPRGSCCEALALLAARALSWRPARKRHCRKPVLQLKEKLIKSTCLFSSLSSADEGLRGADQQEYFSTSKYNKYT